MVRNYNKLYYAILLVCIYTCHALVTYVPTNLIIVTCMFLCNTHACSSAVLQSMHMSLQIFELIPYTYVIDN